MGNVLFMHVTNGKQELLDYIGCRPLTDPLHLDDVFVKFSTSYKLGHDIEVCIVLEKFKDTDHVRMVSFR